jgi:hypothetical protein
MEYPVTRMFSENGSCVPEDIEEEAELILCVV